MSPMTGEERTTKCQGARQSHSGKAHFDRYSLSAMHPHLAFQILWPGIAAIQGGLFSIQLIGLQYHRKRHLKAR